MTIIEEVQASVKNLDTKVDALIAIVQSSPPGTLTPEQTQMLEQIKADADAHAAAIDPLLP